MDPTYVPNPNAADGQPVTTGGSTTFSSAVDPTGVISCTGPGIVLGFGASAGKVWNKTTTGTSSTDWFLASV